MNRLLECRGVRREFGGLAALAGVHLEVGEGEIVGLIGPNGAGKTTLFNVISGSLKPTAGSVFFRGREVTGLSPGSVCRLGIARTYQLVRPFPRLTCLENALVGAHFGRGRGASGREAVGQARAALELAGLGGKPDAVADDLTLSDKRRLELARALATGPKLLLLDEVFSGLHPGEVRGMLETLRQTRARGVTIVLIEHVLRAVLELCDRAIVLHFGQKLAEGAPAEVMNDPRVREAYLGGPHLA